MLYRKCEIEHGNMVRNWEERKRWREESISKWNSLFDDDNGDIDAGDYLECQSIDD